MGVQVDNVPDTGGEIIEDINMADSGNSFNGGSDGAFCPNSPKLSENDEVNFSTGTPKKKVQFGPIFDETEFGPTGQAPVVQESALVNNINQQKTHMTRVDHAKQLREKKRAQFELKREQARQKIANTQTHAGTKDTIRGQLG